jgi:predicted nucleic-acid-binding protein
VVAVDTNVLLRLLIDDPAALKQCEVARARVGAEDGIFVPFVAVVEAVWVLRASFGCSKQQILAAFGRMLEKESYRIAREDIFRNALHAFAGTNVDFGDCLIHAEARREGAELLTFDRKLKRLGGVEVLRPSSS